MSKLSIIIPVYNSEKVLKRCLNSIFSQTYKNIEVICINDGSTDNSLEIMKEFRKTYSNMIIINKKNSGVSNSRNEGIKKASGKYISFIDSDDWISEGLINELMERYKKFEGLLIYPIKKYDGENWFTNELKKEKFNSLDIVKKKNIMVKKEIINSSVNKCFDANIIKQNNIFFKENISISEDLLFNYEYIKYVSSIEYIENSFYIYSIENENSLSRKIDIDKYYELKKVTDIMMNNLNSVYDIKLINFIKVKNVYSIIKGIYKVDGNLNEREEFIKNMINNLNISSIKEVFSIKMKILYLILKNINIIFIDKLAGLYSKVKK